MPPRDFGCAGNGGCIVPVDVQKARASDLLGRQGGRIDAQAIVTMPEHGALARGLVHQNIGALIRAVGPDFDIVQIDAARAQAFELDGAALVIAQRTDIFCAQPSLAQVTIALATCPPGLRTSRSNGTLPP